MLVIRTGYLYFEVLYLIKEKICAKNKGYCTFTESEIVIFFKKTRAGAWHETFFWQRKNKFAKGYMSGE